MNTVQVMLGDRSYPIRIRPGSLADLGETLVREFGAAHVVSITTPRVGEAHFETLARGLSSADLAHQRLDVPEGDRAKTLSHASRLYDSLIDLEADRDTVIVALGGGAVGDLAGFVASTYLRGVALVQVPTTLLAQVDSSVGGKTAVNHSRGKNLIGTFFQPRLVWIDPAVLSTLPASELRCGMAEIIKAGAIWDGEFFAWLEKNAKGVTALDPELLSEAIVRAVRIKAEVVGLDEREAGLRALLNFGHTLGHAIENVLGYREIHHGEAVAIGMMFAARLSERRELAPAGTAERLEGLLDCVGLPTELPDALGVTETREAYLRAMTVDKKVRGRQLGFVVLSEIGRAKVIKLTPEEVFEGADQ
ncbi:MAG: 3-dehydroquinate synthase [Myxococcales bacterium]|nr:3-dehydroquinate synthase [Myxococcales bacterium]